jgi:hypothetical protein
MVVVNFHLVDCIVPPLHGMHSFSELGFSLKLQLCDQLPLIAITVQTL